MIPVSVNNDLTKTLRPDMRNPPLSCCSGLSKRLPKHIGCCYFPWLTPRGGMQVPVAEDTRISGP